MTNTPIILSALATLVAVAIVGVVLCNKTSQLSHAEMRQTLLAVITTWGAFLSAIFVISSYLQTNRAFVESHRPQLLIQVENQFTQGSEGSPRKPVTIIHYRNITTNMFRDLSIAVLVVAEDRHIDLSDLFKPKMIMVGTDQRQRRLDPIIELSKRGFDLNGTALNSSAILLRFTYSYSYNGSIDVVELQEYKWNTILQVWEIV